MVIVAVAIALAASPSAFATAFDAYRHTGEVILPSGVSTYDVMPDGRLAALSGLDLYTETTPGSGQFNLYGTLPTADVSYGAAFLRFSPDGSQIAIGNNGSGGTSLVGVFDTQTLSGTWHTLAHYDAEWFDNTHLAINTGDFNTSSVSLFDINAQTNTTIVNGIQGGSGGVAFDAQGRLFIGNGYANGSGSTTGEIKAFEQSQWQAAITTTPLDFETTGTIIGDVLSASSLGFDIEGNLHVAGGDFSQMDYGYVGLVSATAIESALSGGGVIDPSLAADFLRLDPAPASSLDFYSVVASPVDAELYIRDYGASTVHRYAIPEPTALCLLMFGVSVIGRSCRRHTARTTSNSRTTLR